MELVKVLRELSRRRKLVAVVLAFSLLVGLLLAFRPGVPPHARQYRVSLASSDILVDTRDSQVVTVNKRGPDLSTLTSRANLLGNLMTSGALKEAIAERADVPADQLVVVPPANPNTPGIAPSPVTPPGALGRPDAAATILTLTTDESLPILHVVAQAPDGETARRLSGGAVVALKHYLGSVAASQKIPAIDRLVVREFGSTVVGTATRGLPRRLALAIAIVLALVGCATIIGSSWFARSWRQVADAESDGLEPTEPTDDEHANTNGNGNGAGRSNGSPPHSPVLRFPL